MKTLRILLYSLIMGLFSSHAMAADNSVASQQASAKRPATDDECDPSNWSSNPDIDFSMCEENNHSRM